jgi:hypothetical protein
MKREFLPPGHVSTPLIELVAATFLDVTYYMYNKLPLATFQMRERFAGSLA